MKCIIAYDVSEDRRRARLAALLAAWGDRVQRSVFECVFSPTEAAEVLERARGIINPTTDAVVMYHQCAGCDAGKAVAGQVRTVSEDPYWIV